MIPDHRYLSMIIPPDDKMALTILLMVAALCTMYLGLELFFAYMDQ